MPEPDLAALAAAVADDAEVDWAAAESSAGHAAARQVVRNLRLVSRVAALHKSAAWSVAHGMPEATWRVGAQARALPDPPFTWGPLQVLETVGAGAFGQVFRAWDTRLDREVALKLLAHGDAQAGARPQLGEARLLARIKHPHVVTVFGADQFDGAAGLWMEFLRGRTLERGLRESGPFGAREALLVGIDLAGALAAVHAAGLVHRDVKAQNVMREDGGRIVLMDFGTGRETRAGDAAVGEIAGTPLYMAPELFRREPATVRSDIYALGILLYHLVTGKYPVDARTLDDVRQAHAHGGSVRLRDRRPDLPPAFVAAVERAIAREPAERFETAGAFEAALSGAMSGEQAMVARAASPNGARANAAGAEAAEAVTAAGATPRSFGPRAWLAAVALLAVALTSAVTWWTARPSPATVAFDRHDFVLIAPFENRTMERVLDGTIEFALQEALADTGFVSVVPYQRVRDALVSMRRSPDEVLTERTALEVAVRDGGVKAVVTGRIESVGTVYLLTAGLVEPGSDRLVLRASEEASGPADLMAAVRRLSARLRRALGDHTAASAAAPRLERATTTSLRALQLYSRAVHAVSAGQWEQADALARAALEEDPEFASALATRALALTVLEQQRRSGVTRVQHAETLGLLTRAVALSDGLPERERLFVRALQLEATGEWKASMGAYRALLEIDPGHPMGLERLVGLYGVQEGSRWEELAPLYVRRAELRPWDASANAAAAMALLTAIGDLERAKPFAARAVAAAPNADTFWHADLELLPAFAAWASGDSATADRAIGDVLAQHRHRDAYVDRAVALRVAMGQLRVAEEADAARVPGRRDARRFRAQVALARGDERGARDILAQVTREDALATGPHGLVHLLRRVDLIDRAAEIERWWNTTHRDAGSPDTILQGQVTLGRGEHDEALRVLAKGGPPLPGPLQLMVAQARADALVTLGRPNDAVAALQDASSNVTFAYGPNLSLAVWVETRGQLARTLRAAGRISEAEQVEAQLRPMLSLADPDHVIAAEVSAASPARR
jgi:tetratricopeptide (TPR) repeat protein